MKQSPLQKQIQAPAHRRHPNRTSASALPQLGQSLSLEGAIAAIAQANAAPIE
jgi:hypothetical protein